MKKILPLIILVISLQTQAQSIIPWTEQNGTLGLGYPVPIPVDTPEPFDGFRTYNGLFSKHQSLALNNKLITDHIVGQTRNNRDIWAYVLSDEDNLTKYGVKEGAMLINGSIHAREWQSPEVLTGIMELLDANSQDQSLHQYLLENTSIIAIPVNNVDGLLQTQRFPTQNWLGTDPDFDSSPRDGRMRRKNMLNVDEDLFTQSDHLFGVDLNRNNNPFWATSPRSSPNTSSIVHHGASAQSEPETQARLNAAVLVDIDQVRVYTDVHSFSTVHFSVRTNNTNRTSLMRNLLQDFSRHHSAFPAAKNYRDIPSGPGGGIGATDEYFATTFEVPSWTLEIEPNGNTAAVEYGGFGNNGHDGFILPESQITRVREQLAQTFMVAWYGQAGPPSVTQFRLVEKETQTVVYDASWDIQDAQNRELVENEIDNLLPGEEYMLIVSFDKPMRSRDQQGDIAHLQGQSNYALNPIISANIGGEMLSFESSNAQWLNLKDDSLKSYNYYQDDTYTVDITLPNDIDLSNEDIIWSVTAFDMVGQRLDANPATVVTWVSGQWQNYEDTNGNSSIFGGTDSNYSTPIGSAGNNEFVAAVQPSALYFDPNRSGEGFSYEILSDNRIWIQWFTYDDNGGQRWYSGVGKVLANRIIVTDMLQASGGVFGSKFDGNAISFNTFGKLEILFGGGQALNPTVGFQTVSRTAKVSYTDTNGKKLRTNLQQLSFVKGALNLAEFVNFIAPIEEPVGLISGSWYDPNRSGEGYIIEILEDGRAILIWYTYDLNGKHMWLIDSDGGITINGNDVSLDFNNVMVAEGGIFGDEFNPADVSLSRWGELNFELNCMGSGTVSYSSEVEGFGTGEYNVSKLTQPLVVPYVCDEE